MYISFLRDLVCALVLLAYTNNTERKKSNKKADLLEFYNRKTCFEEKISVPFNKC